MNCCIRLFAAAQTIEPVGHVRWFLISHAHGRESRVTGKQNIFDGALRVNRQIVLMIAFLLHELPARAALATRIEHGGLFPHDAGKAGRIVSKTGGIARHESIRVSEESLEGIGILPAVMPGKNSAVRDDGLRVVHVHKEVAEVDAVAHPLVSDAAGKVLVETKLKMKLRI